MDSCFKVALILRKSSLAIKNRCIPTNTQPTWPQSGSNFGESNFKDYHIKPFIVPPENTRSAEVKNY